MFNKLIPVWLVAKRELRDQLRDWRVLTPMLILIVFFPILMNEFAKQTVDFLNRFNANLVLEKLVPFSIMIIGFFPITVSLVVALESFVGEKERGTIEPILSSPLDDWQMYFGKLLVGVTTPLAASYLSITLYMLMISQQTLKIPSLLTMTQLILLTTAHAFLMVSAAIVISVQSTTVKAANLLASFVVIPVAILMQSEAGMLFWGNDRVLWLAVAGVSIISLLLIRLGIAHFQREFLLGREIDVLNLRWILKTFWSNFTEGTASVGEWYLRAVAGAFRRILPALILLMMVAGISIWLGHDWVIRNFSDKILAASPETLAKLEERIRDLPDLANLQKHISAPFLFFNNTRATVIIFLAGLVSFGVLGVIIYMINVGLLGGAFAIFELLGVHPWPIFLGGVLPHGIVEIPALMIGSAAMLYFGVGLVTPQSGKSLGEVVLELLADWTKIFLGLVVPMFAMAALIEAYITPGILLNSIK